VEAEPEPPRRAPPESRPGLAEEKQRRCPGNCGHDGGADSFGGLRPLADTNGASADQPTTTTLAIVPGQQRQKPGAPAGERTMPAEVFAGSRRPLMTKGRRKGLAWLNMLQRRDLFGNGVVDNGFRALRNQGKPEDDVRKTCAGAADPLRCAGLWEPSCSPKRCHRSPRYEPWASSSPGTKGSKVNQG